MHYPIKVHLKLNQLGVGFTHANVIAVFTIVIHKFKLMIVIGKTQSRLIDSFTYGIQLSRQQAEVLKRSECRIQPRPGDITLSQCMGSFYTLVDISRHRIGRLIEKLSEVVMTAGSDHSIISKKLFER